MDREILIDLPHPIDNDFNKLQIVVGYEKGGLNHLFGTSSKRGIYLYIKPAMCDEKGNYSTVIVGNKRLNGFKVCVKEIGRNNQKQIDLAFEKIKQSNNLNKWAEHYFNGKYQLIVNEAIEMFN